MNNQLASEDEYAYIATAINGLKTVTNNPVADDIYEKITAISKNNNTGMILDFSVLREGDEKLMKNIYIKKINFLNRPIILSALESLALTGSTDGYEESRISFEEMGIFSG